VRACVRACTRRLTCPLLPGVNNRTYLGWSRRVRVRLSLSKLKAKRSRTSCAIRGAKSCGFGPFYSKQYAHRAVFFLRVCRHVTSKQRFRSKNFAPRSWLVVLLSDCKRESGSESWVAVVVCACSATARGRSPVGSQTRQACCRCRQARPPKRLRSRRRPFSVLGTYNRHRCDCSLTRELSSFVPVFSAADRPASVVSTPGKRSRHLAAFPPFFPFKGSVERSCVNDFGSNERQRPFCLLAVKEEIICAFRHRHGRSR
jgi:hypothetical protein